MPRAAAMLVAMLAWGVVGARTAGAAASLAGIVDSSIEPGPCLTDAQRAEIRAEIEASILKLKAEGILPESITAPMAPSTFGWPLRLKVGLDDPGYHGVQNFVDQDATAGVLDFNCGSRTYDGHRGTDFSITPFSWLKMDLGYVEIVAVEAGTIIYKHDGEYDRRCANGPYNWNAVYVQSADGSVVWYGHMKSGSLTSKLVGETVAKGEYLGLVGSSGSSTGPHLHLEVYDSGGTLIDPYAGSCNPTVGSSWWETQRPYYDSAVNLLMTFDALPSIPPCPGQQIPNDQIYFTPGQTAYFGAYYRDLLNTQATDYAIYDAANGLVDQWTYTPSQPYYVSVGIIFSDDLPTNRPSGWWRFEVSFQSVTYSHWFYVGDCLKRPVNLVSWWPGEGNANDVKGLRHGTLSGTATYAAAKVGQGFSFDGAGYVQVSDSPAFEFTSQMAMEAWIWPQDLSTARQIISKFGASGNYAYQLGVSSGGALRCDISGNGTTYEALISPPGALSPSTWAHVAMTFNAGLLELYVNGRMVASKLSSITSLYASGTTQLTIGRDPAGLQYFSGLIDEPAVYNRALEAREIMAIYDTDASGTCTCTDADGDGYGANGDTSCPNGTAVDCNDSNPAIHPGAADICNGVDDDCNGQVDPLFCFADYAFLTGVSNSSAAWGDCDNDGDLDILTAGWTGTAAVTKVYRNSGGANPTFTDIGAILIGVTASSVAWGDYDNDGDLDILLAGSDGAGTPVSKVYRNNGGAGPTFTDIAAGLTGVEYSSVAWGDFDNDGDLDILLTGSNSGHVPITSVYRNSGVVGSFAFTAYGVALPGVSSSAAAWGDYDNDGDLDVLLAGWDATSTRIAKVYRNGGGVNPTFTLAATLPGVAPASAAWGDYDNDGDLDIVLAGENSSAIKVARVYANMGSFFLDVGGLGTGVSPSAVAWGDYNSNGTLDILLTGWDYAASPLLNLYGNSGGTFSYVGTPGSGGVGGSTVAWGDFDNEGDLDILLTGQTPSVPVARVIRNTGFPKNTLPTTPTGLYPTRVDATTVELHWEAASDVQTPAAALTYNLRIGLTPGGSQISAPMANGVNGYRRIPEPGNAGARLSRTVRVPGPTTYYWTVQTVDGACAGSPFASEQTFNLATLDASDGAELPTQLALHGSMPNPFDRSTTLAYDLPRAESVRLEVFDLGGRRVRTLVAESKPAGRHQAVWDGTDDGGRRLPAGVYLCQLRAGTLTMTRRLVRAR